MSTSPDPAPQAEPPVDPKADPNALDRAAEQLSGIRRALEIQPDDPWYVGFAKIAGMAVVAILLLALSPLIALGLVTAFAVAV